MPERRKSAATPPSRQAKGHVLLVTQDDSLWPQVGGSLSVSLHLKQVDGVDELLATVPASQSAIVLWDARGVEAPAAALSKLQLHSSHFAVVVLDDAAAGATWQPMTVRGQIVSFVPMPLDAQRLNQAIEAAGTEVGVRGALLGDAPAAVPTTEPPKKKTTMLVAGIAALVLAGAAVAYFALRGPSAEPVANTAKPAGATAARAPASASSRAPSDAPAAAAPESPVGGPASASASDDKVYQLLQSAQQAMRDRHYIDPAAGSALKYYHDALLFDPNNDEAHQGMQRLAEVLFSRVQSALDERKFDIALQSLETARSISPTDPRLAALDARVASMRAELGTGQIQAAINAQAYDRAEQLLDEAVRVKALSDAKAAQLRDDLNRRRKESDIDGLERLIDARLQQDHLVEPHNDNATYYLDEARRAGATAAALAPRVQELARRLHLRDTATAAAAAAPVHVQPERPAFADLAATRLSQGKIVDPDGDSALYYVNQLSATDPTNSHLAQLASEVQLQIVARATAALDASETDTAKNLVRLAAGLGASPELASVTDRLNKQIRAREASEPTPTVDVQSLVAVYPLKPEYPPDALQSGVQGWVDLTFMVTPEGKVTNVVVVDSTPPNIFNRAARDAMARTRYKPVIQNGRPIAVVSKVRVGFKLAAQ
jgi:TonB family protein